MGIESSATKTSRSVQKQQTPFCIWFTGFSGAGKSTLATLLENYLHERGRHTYLLDGDKLRLGLNKDLGFSLADRSENIRRVAEVSQLMVDAGLIVISAFISPVRQDRLLARQLFAEGEFVEVFVNAPLDECERRDVKGLYEKARAGKVKNFTGIDSPYEISESPELIVDTLSHTPEECLHQIIDFLTARFG